MLEKILLCSKKFRYAKKIIRYDRFSTIFNALYPTGVCEQMSKPIKSTMAQDLVFHRKR